MLSLKCEKETLVILTRAKKLFDSKWKRIGMGLGAVILGWGAAFFSPAAVFGQNPSSGREKPSTQAGWMNAAPRIFLDGYLGGEDYIRTEIPFVNYVRDRKDADIHLLSTMQSSSAGMEFLIEFIGQGGYKDIHFTLKYFSDRYATSDERRQGLVRVLKKGLMPFLSRTDLEDMLSVSFKEKVKPAPVKDPWNRWLFSVNLNGSFDGQKFEKFNYFQYGFGINRVTSELKISCSFNASVSNSMYTIENEEINTSKKQWNFGTLVVKSLGEHWSVGGWIAASSSTYSNEKYTVRFAPAIEFDLFPYSQATRKQLTFLYRLNCSRFQYLNETIYDKTSETLWSESLTIGLNVIQPWGSAYASVVGSHYFHDFSKNRLSLYGGLSIRLWKGFQVNCWSDFAMIHDQLSLIKGCLSDQDVFLRLKELSTTYSYAVSVGFSYSFGSSLSRAVNPRFGGGSSGYYY